MLVHGQFCFKKSLTVYVYILLFGFTVFSANAESSISKETIQQINTLLQENRRAEAEQIYKGLIDKYPQSDTAVESLRGLGMLYVDWAKPRQAEQIYQELTSKYPANEATAEAVYNIAMRYKATKKYQKAIELFRYAIAHGLCTRAALFNRAEIAVSYYLANDPDSGKAELDSLIEELSRHDDSVIDETTHLVGKRFQWVGRDDIAMRVHEYNADRFCQSSYAERKYAGWSEVEIIRYFKNNPEKIEQRLRQLRSKCKDACKLAEILAIASDNYLPADINKWLELREHIVSTYPDQFQAMNSQTLLVCHYIKTGNIAGAEKGIENLMKRYAGFQEQPMKMSQVGQCYLCNGQYDRAKSFFGDMLVQLSAGSDACLFRTGQLLSDLMAAETGSADTVMNTLWSEYGRDEYVKKVCYYVYTVARTYNWNGRPEDALRLHGYTADWFGDQEFGLLSQMEKAILHIKLNDWAGAEAAAARMISVFQDQSRLGEAGFTIGENYYTMAVQQQQQGDYQIAGVHFNHAIDIWAKILSGVPKCQAHPSAVYYTGSAYYKMKQYPQALACFEKVATEWPDFEYAQDALISSSQCISKLYSEGSITQEKMEDDLEKLVNTNAAAMQSDAFAGERAWIIGNTAYRKKNWNDAARYLEIFLEKNVTDPRVLDVYFVLAEAYRNIGENQQAVKYYMEYLNNPAATDPERLIKAQMQVHKVIRRTQ